MKENSKLNTAGNNEVVKTLENEYAEIIVEPKIITDITLIEVRIYSQDSLRIFETREPGKHDQLTNQSGLIYKFSVKVIPYVMTWDSIMPLCHKTYIKSLQIPMNVEPYIQSIVLKKTVEIISFDQRRELESGFNVEESCDRASLGVIE
ncbi:hypothetical protein CWI38_2132p0020 [Hamiltosporidium tvaerminnensis]|uniref:Uncharacterized protein n=1 Tax=Hamiltosporidium tvaerminnensis TaxID=1176355 RepID=A0A4Q9LQ08_9MICR|nr:hypothetical protein CWI38_2132p0020 [Hamiltosporidium tvaerminnensis]